MKTALECLPCLLRQTLCTARLSTPRPELQKKIMDNVSRLLPDLDFDLTPPENSIQVYGEIARLSGNYDPFADLKKESNTLALHLRNEVMRSIENAEDPLYAALIFSIAGNIIDYGSQQNFDARQTISDCLSRTPAINDYAEFKKDIAEARSVLYLGDNCGELVFDGLVIDRLPHEVIFAVKEKPIINDALMEDAIDCGLDRISTVISNGTDCPGTPLGRCSAVFLDHFNRADLIISKGQGNFETLSEVERPIYFLLTVKCPIVGNHITELSGKKVKTGEMVLMRNIKTPGPHC